MKIRIFAIITLVSLMVNTPALSKGDECGWFDPVLKFSDSTESCITKKTPFFNINGFGGPSVSLRDAIRSHSSYALAVTKDSFSCPMKTGIAWDWGPRDTTIKAIEFCEKKFSSDIRVNCKCDVLLEFGRSSLTSTEFWDKVDLLESQHLAGGKALGAVRKEAASMSQEQGGQIQSDVVSGFKDDPGQVEIGIRPPPSEKLVAPANQGTSKISKPSSNSDTSSLETPLGSEYAGQDRMAKSRSQASVEVEPLKSNAQDSLNEEKKNTMKDREEQRRLIDIELAREKERVRRLEAELELARLKTQLAKLTASSEATPTKRKSSTPLRERVALIIGNNNYRNIPLLENAVSDAAAVSNALKQFGFRVHFERDLNEKDFKRSLRSFQQSLSGGEEIVFFYAGHGVQIEGVNYLLPTDTGDQSARQIEDEGIPLQRILSDFSESKAAFSLAMIDACRDNPFKKLGRSMHSRGLAPTTATTGQMIIFSAGAGQQALDRLSAADTEKNGLFTRVLLEKIWEKEIPIHQIMREVREEVSRLAQTVGHVQVPAIYDQAIGDFYFR